MNVWALDGESVESRLAGVKKTCFADQVEVVSTSGWGVDAPSQRRKQRGRVEFLVEDQHGSDDDDPRKGQCDSPTETSNAKASLISSADVVEAVESLRGAEPAQVTSSKKDRRSRKEEKLESQTRSIQDITVHHLVREFLLMHCHDDVVKILDQERPMPLLDTTEIKQLNQRLTGTDESTEIPSGTQSLLERFLLCSNEAKLRARAKRTIKERSASADKKSRTKTSTTRRKPALNVITNNLDQVAGKSASIIPISDQQDGDYNRLNHPGSTPHHQPNNTVLGEPGSTPMARSQDLRILGFEDVDNVDEKAPGSIPTEEAKDEEDPDLSESVDQISHYALHKRNSKTGLKHVQLGNPGSTPTKEYIFFRETPPSFVTETIEDAVEVFEKLGSDPDFVRQAAVVERFIELQSSEVSKYMVGQLVEGLGAQSDITGVVSKIFGSRLCGTAGPGTIVVDTCPEGAASG